MTRDEAREYLRPFVDAHKVEGYSTFKGVVEGAVDAIMALMTRDVARPLHMYLGEDA